MKNFKVMLERIEFLASELNLTALDEDEAILQAEELSNADKVSFKKYETEEFVISVEEVKTSKRNLKLEMNMM